MNVGTNSNGWMIFVNQLSKLWQLVHELIVLVMGEEPMETVDNQSFRTITYRQPLAAIGVLFGSDGYTTS